MLPLASASGLAVIVLVVVSAALFLSWLLHTEQGDDASAEQPDEQTERDA